MRSGRINLLLVLLDGILALLSVWAASDWSWLAHASTLPALPLPSASWFLTFSILWVLVSDRLQLSLFHPLRSDLLARVVVASGVAAMGAVLLTRLLGAPLQGFHASAFVADFFFLIATVRMARRALYLHRHLGPDKRHRVVIVGGGMLARELAAALQQDPAKRYEVAGFLAPETEPLASMSPGLAIEGTMTSVTVPEFLAERKIDQIYFTLPNSGDHDVKGLVHECRELGINVSFVPHGYELFVTRSVLRNIGGIPLVAVDERQTREEPPFLRTLADTFIAVALLVCLAPLILAVAIVVRRIRGSAFRAELRSGVGARVFPMHRFNVASDVTATGWFERWLQITKISELPQLWNVVRGDMSLVGPRAVAAQPCPHHSECQHQRIQSRPGVTGYAQLYGLQSNARTAGPRCDFSYSSSWSPLLEMTLIIQTLWFILRRVAVALFLPAKSYIASHPLPTGLEVASVNGSQPSAD